MPDIHVRIYFREADGTLVDGQHEFGLESFAGFLPNIGDQILSVGVLQGLDRHDPANRHIWTVVGRVFNPRDFEDTVVLVVEERPPHPTEYQVVAV